MDDGQNDEGLEGVMLSPNCNKAYGRRTELTKAFYS